MEGKRRERAQYAVCCLYLVWHAASQWTGTLLPFLQWSAQPPLSPLAVSYIQAAGSLANVAGAFFLGGALDSLGARRAFALCALLTAAYYAGLSYAGSIAAFFLLQLLRVGFQFDLVAETYLATTTPENQRTSAMLSLGTPLALAMLCGPYLASWTTMSLSLRLSQLLCAPVLLAVFLPLLAYLLPDSHAPPGRLGFKLATQRYLRLLVLHDGLIPMLCLRLALVIGQIGYELVSRQFLMRALVRQPADSLGMLAVIGGAVLATQVAVLPILQARLRPQAILGLSFALLATAYFGLPWIRSYGQLAALLGLQSAAYSVGYAETSCQISGSVGKGEVGLALALAGMLQWAAHCLVPPLVGHAVTTFHYSHVFVVAGVVSAAAGLVIAAAGRSLNARVTDVLPDHAAKWTD